MNNNWVQIPNFSRYEASHSGEIRKRETKRILKGTLRYATTKKSGTYIETLRCGIINDSGEIKWCAFHNLIAACFLLPKPTQKHTIDHKDRNPLNNNVSNLRWATKKEQIANTGRTKNHNRKVSMAELDEWYVLSKDHTLQEIAKRAGLCRTQVFSLLKFMHPIY